MSDSWMSIIEYARIYNVSDMTVRRRIKTGRLNAELRDGKYYIPIKEGAQQASLGQVSTKQEIEFEIDLSPTYEEPKEVKMEHREAPLSSRNSEIQLERLAETFEIALDQVKQREELLKANFESERKLLTAKLSFAQNFELAIEQIKQREDLLKANIESDRKVYAEKINFMASEIKNRDKEISHLKKEIEDLEILIKLFEEKTPA